MNKLILGVLLACVLIVSANFWQTSKIVALKGTDDLHQERPSTVNTLTTTWNSASGQHTVTTTQLPDETLRDFIARHEAAVKAAQQVFPPI